MTNSTHKPFSCTSGDKTGGTMDSFKDEVELEELDHQTGDQYLPMDIYIDPGTIKEHFQRHRV